MVSDGPEVRGERASVASPRVVVVHSGARDSYQVAVALAEAGMLEALVTDFFWFARKPWAQNLASLLPSAVREMLAHRSERRLPSSCVKLWSITGAATLVLNKFPHLPLQLRSRMMRHGDKVLGTTAGKLARRKGCNLLSYSYYGHAAFSRFRRDGILVHQHECPGDSPLCMLPRGLLEKRIERFAAAVESVPVVGL